MNVLKEKRCKGKTFIYVEMLEKRLKRIAMQRMNVEREYMSERNVELKWELR